MKLRGFIECKGLDVYEAWGMAGEGGELDGIEINLTQFVFILIITIHDWWNPLERQNVSQEQSNTYMPKVNEILTSGEFVLFSVTQIVLV